MSKRGWLRCVAAGLASGALFEQMATDVFACKPAPADREIWSLSLQDMAPSIDEVPTSLEIWRDESGRLVVSP